MQIKKFVFSMFFLMPLMQFAGISSFAADSYTKYDVNAMKQRVQDTKTQKKTVKVYAVCDDAAGKTGGKEYCIKDFFEPTNVQVMQAIALAKAYALEKNGHTIYCGGSYRKSWNDDYIKCSDGTNFYEFRFDDIYESLDNTIQYSVKDAVCRLYGGRLDDNSSSNCMDVNQWQCHKINEKLQSFGYSANYSNPMNGIAICKMDVESKSASNYTLKTAFGIDNKKFMNLQIKSGADLQFLLRRYAESQLKEQGKTLTSFSCNDSFNTYYTGGIMSNPKDDILTCKVNGQQVDFLFDDMNENIKITSDGGTAGLQCIAANGGVYDGKNCHGFSKEECTQLNGSITGGTRWDETLDTCVLNSSAAAKTLDKVTNVATGVGVTVGLVAITIATGGTSTPLLVATTLTLGGTALTMDAQANKEKNIQEFLAKSAVCQNNICAENTLIEFLKESVQYVDDMSGQISDALEDELVRLLNLVPAESTFYQKLLEESIKNSNDITNYSDWSELEKQAFWGNVISFAGVVVGLGGVTGIWNTIKAQKNAVGVILQAKLDKNLLKAATNIVSTTKKEISATKTINKSVSNLETQVQDVLQQTSQMNLMGLDYAPITQAHITESQKSAGGNRQIITRDGSI